MNIEDVSKLEEGTKNQYYNYSNPEEDTNLDNLANGVSKTSVAYGDINQSKETDSGRIMSDQVFIDPDGKVPLPYFKYKSSEGGHGSGKRGHQPYMKSIEFGGDYVDCPHCEVMVQKENDKCPICKKGF